MILTLPKKGGYSLEATLFEEGKEVDRGYRSVYDLESLPADSKSISLRIDGSNTGIIAPDETAIRSVNLTVADRYNYVVDVLIWSNSIIVGQGQDYVQLNATTMLGEKERLAGRGTNTGAFINQEAAAEPAEMSVGRFENATSSREATKEQPDFLALTATAMIGLAAVALRKRRE